MQSTAIIANQRKREKAQESEIKFWKTKKENISD